MVRFIFSSKGDNTAALEITMSDNVFASLVNQDKQIPSI